MNDTAVHPVTLTVLRLLADGLKDEAIAHRLGVSLRTVRRHVAEYMAEVGATNRFAAGVIACRQGVV